MLRTATDPRSRLPLKLESPIDIRGHGLPSLHSITGNPTDPGRIVLEIEWFTEAEIAAQLSTLLASYRAFYLGGPDDSSETASCEDRARQAQKTLKAIFQAELSAEDEAALLKENEEDVMKLLIAWINERGIPPTARSETLPNARACLERLVELGTVPVPSAADDNPLFIRKITLVQLLPKNWQANR
jgi:hypothetical protein